MALSVPRRQLPTAARTPRLPAAVASARVARASLLVGAFAAASALLVLLRLLESWRINPPSGSDRVSIFGQQVSYPTANAGAVVILVLAAVGLWVIVLSVVGTVRELLASRRFHRHLARHEPRFVHGAVVITDERPLAFCAGLVRPRVYISSGALAALGEDALEAVLAHERHHARRRDPLRLCAARVLARALHPLPGLRALTDRHRALAELSADESAIETRAGDRAGLAAAMLGFTDPSTGASGGVDPARVDHLLGHEPNWRFPLGLCLAGVGTIALLLTAALLAARVARGTATLAPPFLSSEPCIIVLAAIPATAVLAATLYLRR